MRIGRTALSGIAIVALLGGIGLGNLLTGRLGPGAEAPAIQGAIYQQPRAIPQFQLEDQHGKPFTLEDFKGVWTLVYFGYTYCPDVCPMTLASLGTAQANLAAAGQDDGTAYVFISVDPERDSAELRLWRRGVADRPARSIHRLVSPTTPTSLAVDRQQCPFPDSALGGFKKSCIQDSGYAGALANRVYRSKIDGSIHYPVNSGTT